MTLSADQLQQLHIFKNQFIILRTRDDTNGIQEWRIRVKDYFGSETSQAFSILGVMLKTPVTE